MTTTALAPETRTCPTWCTDHNGFSDGSDDWHEGRTRQVHGFEFYVSTGSMTGAPELFMPTHGCSDGMSLEAAEELAHGILAAVAEARSGVTGVTPADREEYAAARAATDAASSKLLDVIVEAGS